MQSHESALAGSTSDAVFPKFGQQHPGQPDQGQAQDVPGGRRLLGARAGGPAFPCQVGGQDDHDRSEPIFRQGRPLESQIP